MLIICLQKFLTQTWWQKKINWNVHSSHRIWSSGLQSVKMCWAFGGGKCGRNKNPKPTKALPTNIIRNHITFAVLCSHFKLIRKKISHQTLRKHQPTHRINQNKRFKCDEQIIRVNYHFKLYFAKSKVDRVCGIKMAK